jgi:hypothetical protein
VTTRAGTFALGFLLGVTAGAGGVFYAVRKPAPENAITIAAPTAPDAGHGKKRGRSRAATTLGSGTDEPRTDEPIALGPADHKIGAEGDALRAANTVDMGAGEARDLGQAEIDGALAQRSGDVVRCITQARGAAPITGRVVAGVVVDPAGRVTKTRIEAPAYLLAHGLYDCARRPLLALRFPATGRETVVTVPFDVTDSP